MKLIKIIFFIFVLSSHILANENKIIVKINNDIITSIDLLNEINYLKALDQNFKNFEKNEIIQIAKNSLIREKIKKIELKENSLEININDDYFSSFISNFIKENNFDTVENFKKYLLNNNIKFETIREKISVEIIWNRLIYQKFSKNVKINKQDIEKQILSKNKLQEFLLSEILFTLDNDENLDEKYEKITNTIQEKNFENAVSIFSLSDSVKNNGKIGWVEISALNKKIKNAILELNQNEITKPIPIPGGFLILKVNKIREIEKNLNLQDQINKVSNQIMNKQLNQYSVMYFNKIKKDIKINEF